jgi:methanethiol S-methyltransferase
MRVIAGLGALLFAASLGYFGWFYLVLLGRVPAGTLAAADLVFNVALFSGFALHHSIFARSGIKQRLARVVPAALERSCYVWIASLGLLAVCLRWRPLPGVAWAAAGPFMAVALLVQAAGVALTLHSASRIDIWELSGVRQVVGRRGPAAPLEVEGPYRWVRHPIYLGWVLIVFAVPTMTVGRLVFAVVSTVYLAIAVPFEERSLTAEFGPAYTAYQRQVRWRIVPGLW